MPDDPLGPQAEHVRRILAAADELSPTQQTRLARAAAAVPADQARAARSRALAAATRSGRMAAAMAALDSQPRTIRGVAVAVLVADLITAEDHATLTNPWLAACSPVLSAVGAA